MNKYEINVIKDGADPCVFTLGEEETILSGIRRNCSKDIPRGCAGGGCGICKILVKSGDYEIFKPMSRAHIGEQEAAAGAILACCARPKSDMTIAFFGK